MTWEIAVGFFTIVGAFSAVMQVVMKINRPLICLDDSVRQLKKFMEKQAKKNEDFVKKLAAMINTCPNKKGGVYRLGLHSITVRFMMGQTLAATPDGRFCGESTSLNTRASFGADREGITAHIISVTRIDSSDSPNSVTLDLEFMSNRLCLSKKQTARIIFEGYKASLSELINERRLAYALDLVTESDLSMSEIAERANFRSENYFFLRFKKAFGKTPLKYRKERKSNLRG